MTFQEDYNGIKYQVPHKDILALADVNPSPIIRFNSEASFCVSLHRQLYKSIADLSQNEIKLAGIRINPDLFINSRETYFHDVTIRYLDSDIEHHVANLPQGGQMARFAWNHSQTKMAFLNVTSEGVELWIIDILQKQAKKLTDAIINGNVGTTFLWMKDDLSLIVSCKPDLLPKIIDKSMQVPQGPAISENNGQKAQVRTYQDLLKDSIDELNFTTLCTSELRQINVADGSQTIWKGPAIYDDISLSPDGEFLMVTEVKKPFSYLVQYDRFPMTTYIYDKKGMMIEVVVENPLLEELPKGFMAVMKGRRGLRWRADHPATIVWAEALDDGDPEVLVENRDAIFQWPAPFDGKPKLMYKTKDRFAGIMWCNDNLALIYEQWWNTRLIRMVFINPSDPNFPSRIFNERNIQDNYSDPGSFVTEKNSYGYQVIKLENQMLKLIGDGMSAEGKFPFIDEVDLGTLSTNRLFQASDPYRLETIISAVNGKDNVFITKIESKNTYPNYYFRNILTGDLSKITHFKNPFEILQNVHKEVIKYTRADGVELSATLYLPVDYASNAKYPMIIWAYPREFKDKDSAGQISSSPNEFIFPFYGSPIYWVNRGYVVLEDASMPIIGEGDQEPNDTYVSQLVANAKAAIEAVHDLGYIDKNRVAVGGHSYGAFMTACLLSASDLFAAGIARSGAYNRTLTPFGFQSEERNLWEASDVYWKMSPFMEADKMKTPLLLIHGGDDNNAGTHTMQSERYFNALKGLGATVRLVILPKESHGYMARESILHMLWEQDEWLEKHVKNRNNHNNE